MLLTGDQRLTFAIPTVLVLALLAGMMRKVSSAYYRISLPSVTSWRSATLITYDACPIAEPCTMLALIVLEEEETPLNLTQWE
jgi:hypothetical protein